MNILMILETPFPPDLRVENEIDALIEAGHNITIIAGFRTKVERIGCYEKAKLIRVFVPRFIHKSSIGCLNYSFYFNFWKKKITKVLKEDHYDAVHIHDLPLSQVVITLKYQLSLNYKITLDLHENYPDFLKIAKHTQTRLGKYFFDYLQWLEYENKIIKQVDTVITVVEEMKERIVFTGVDPDKVVVVSNTFNSSKFTAPNRNPEEKNFILFYGGGVTIDRGLQ
jgi:glycosyltransferase involved in cell wall biosynthesis